MHWEENTCTPFVVCTAWNGSEWQWGHYFRDLINAAKYFDEVTNPRPKKPLLIIHPDGDADEAGWDYPFEEIDYLLERAVDEHRELHFMTFEGRLVEMKED